MYNNSAIVPYTIMAYSLEHKKRYNIVIGEEKYIYVLQQVRRDFPLHVKNCCFIGCKDKASSRHLNGFPDGSNLGSTVKCRGVIPRYTVHLH